MIESIKQYIGLWLFKSVKDTLDLERDLLELAKKNFEIKKANVNVVDLVREKLKGFNPRLLNRIKTTDDANILVEEFGENEEGADAFLAAIKPIAESKEFQVLLDYLNRNQIVYSAQEGLDLNQINFGRATLNGTGLVREELDSLLTIYIDRHKPSEHYDKHEVV